MYVLDTNAVIDLFEGCGRVAERILAKPPREIGLATVVPYELETGALKSERRQKNRRQIEELAKLATLLPFGATEARAAARIRVELEARGRTQSVAHAPAPRPFTIARNGRSPSAE